MKYNIGVKILFHGAIKTEGSFGTEKVRRPEAHINPQTPLSLELLTGPDGHREAQPEGQFPGVNVSSIEFILPVGLWLPKPLSLG